MVDCKQRRYPTMQWLMEQIDDERKAEKMYCEYGFPEIAQDEAKHARMLKQFLEKI